MQTWTRQLAAYWLSCSNCSSLSRVALWWWSNGGASQPVPHAPCKECLSPV